MRRRWRAPRPRARAEVRARGRAAWHSVMPREHVCACVAAMHHAMHPKKNRMSRSLYMLLWMVIAPAPYTIAFSQLRRVCGVLVLA